MNKTILIADSDVSSIEAVRTHLRVAGFDVITVTNGDEAIKLLSLHSIDICIAAFDLPGKSGLEVSQYAKKDHVNVPVIIVSGNGSLETERCARIASPYFYMVKPVNLKDLDAVIERIFTASFAGAVQRRVV